MRMTAGSEWCRNNCIYNCGGDNQQEEIECSVAHRCDPEWKERCPMRPDTVCHSADCGYFHSCRVRRRRTVVTKANRERHRELCLAAGKWLRSQHSAEPWKMPWKYAAVELVTANAETPDAWATNGYESVVVEVKVSRSDFMADQKKYSRSENARTAGHMMGNYRYYLCPDGLLTESDIPEGWGLLYHDGKTVKIVRRAVYQDTNRRSDIIMLISIMRRLGIKEQVFDFRKD